mmetsp:Transcript_103155/g.183312  ORF Transcript_103155/g.183312 Transcript_103155/m.183312 type:complete len:682 (-) Transcript_103155:65-2110(-)
MTGPAGGMGLPTPAGDEAGDIMLEVSSCLKCGAMQSADAYFCRQCGNQRDIRKALQDPEQIITFLCRKFSGLIDRVRLAEGKQAAAQKRAGACEQRLRESMERRQSMSTQMQSVLRTHLAEAESARQRLVASQKAKDFQESELKRYKEGAVSLCEQVEEISTRCREDQRNVEETGQRLAMEDEAATSYECERQRLKDDTEAMSQCLAAQEEELAAGYERDRHRRADLRNVESRLQDAGRQRQVADKRVQTFQDELSNALKQVNSYRERLDDAKFKQQKGEEELRLESFQLEDISAENAKSEQEAAISQDGLERMRELKTKLEAALRENIDAHSRLKASTISCRSVREANNALDCRQREVVAGLTTVAEGVNSATADLGRWQQRLQGLGDSLRHLRTANQELEEQSRGAGTAGASLQSELQRVFAMAEQLRSERDEAASAASELQRKLRAAEPALETARRRARELEESLEDTSGDLSRAKQRKDSLLREVSQCREKMRGLRKRHIALSDKAQTLEKRLVRSSGSFGGAAGFVAAAGELSHASSAVQLDQPSSLVMNPRASKSAPQLPGLQARVHAATEATTSKAESESLGYLRQWVELEEARLNVARTPPEPSPVPSAPAEPRPPALESGGFQGADVGFPSPPPPRSAAALAALSAGAEPLEAIAMLDLDQREGAAGSGRES